jgi:hypothetical protein
MAAALGLVGLLLCLGAAVSPILHTPLTTNTVASGTGLLTNSTSGTLGWMPLGGLGSTDGGTVTNFYLYTTNLYAGDTYVSNYFETNAFQDTYVSNFFQTNLYAYSTNLVVTNVTITNVLEYWTNDYVSNFWNTNIYQDTYLSNYYVTNLYSTTEQITTNFYLSTSNFYATNIYTYTLAVNDYQWPGPSNALDFSKQLQHYITYTPAAITNTGWFLAGYGNPCLLSISNAASTNISLYLTDSGWLFGSGESSPYTVTNQSVLKLWFFEDSLSKTVCSRPFQ